MPPLGPNALPEPSQWRALGVQLQIFQSSRLFLGSVACFIPTLCLCLVCCFAAFFFFFSQGDPVQLMGLTPEMLLLPKATDRETCFEHSLKRLDLGEPPVTCFSPRSPVLIMGLDALSGNLQLKNLNVARCRPFPPCSVAHLHPIIQYVLKHCEQCV